MNIAAVVIACALGLMLGFAAHRSSICTVRACAELMSARTGYMAMSIGKSMLWVVLLVAPAMWLLGRGSAPGWQLTSAALLGGFVFGAGAAVNGACAYSTMARLVDGEGSMLVTIAGFALGIVGFAGLTRTGAIPRPSPAPALIGPLLLWALALAALLILWGLYEVARLWRTRPATSMASRCFVPQYRLSTAAMLIGLAGAVIFLLYGPSGYSSTFDLVIEHILGTRPPPLTERWLIMIAVLTGMLASTLQRGSFRIDLRPKRAWLRNLVGGALMGLGVALTPGGNDVLVLYAVPTLSPHGIPAFVAMAVGIVVALIALRMLFGIEAKARCENDIFLSDAGLGRANRHGVPVKD